MLVLVGGGGGGGGGITTGVVSFGIGFGSDTGSGSSTTGSEVTTVVVATTSIIVISFCCVFSNGLNLGITITRSDTMTAVMAAEIKKKGVVFILLVSIALIRKRTLCNKVSFLFRHELLVDAVADKFEI